MYMEYPGIPGGTDFTHRSGAVHVSIYEVPSKPAGNRHGPFEVNP